MPCLCFSFSVTRRAPGARRGWGSGGTWGVSSGAGATVPRAVRAPGAAEHRAAACIVFVLPFTCCLKAGMPSSAKVSLFQKLNFKRLSRTNQKVENITRVKMQLCTSAVPSASACVGCVVVDQEWWLNAIFTWLTQGTDLLSFCALHFYKLT